MLPPSLFYFAGGYVETSYGGQAILDTGFPLLRLRSGQVAREWKRRRGGDG